ncbi:3-oxoacyl-[acyl-carrier-protein] reductase [Desulfonema limicola]|uniref:3-oxoacyl-[acyl-carrier-protein] reductase n=1 Tax=Desulfonema limicola TaxID=45656 RepID=A0A975B9I7_9BACT|nr:3-oxoacyl-[acyl-carrier-protein] reductase [Desulfonema limicola]QTA81171.1 3-oxoacyl-[acyl-carrier-protein] reductase [Desulfonema limicola]
MSEQIADQIKKTVVVTGGSKGIGRAICLAFAKSDTRIYFNYSSDNNAARETERLVKDAGGFASGFKADVALEDDVKAFLDKVLEETGRIDILVNNAGITRDGLVVRMKTKDWDDVLDINLKGTFLCSKIASKTMLKQRSGRIINLSSVVGAMGNPGQANYAASKAGIIGLTKALAKELASRNITVNAVAPGYVETEMTAGLPEKARQAMIDQIPLGCPGNTDDVANAVFFLGSEKASYITGQVIHVSGGMYM